MNEKQSWGVVGIVIGGLTAVVVKLTVPMPASASLVLGAVLLVAGAAVGGYIGSRRA